MTMRQVQRDYDQSLITEKQYKNIIKMIAEYQAQWQVDNPRKKAAIQFIDK